MSLEINLFLRITAGTFICYGEAPMHSDDIVDEDMYINMLLIHQYVIKKDCIKTLNKEKHLQMIQKIEFNSFVDEGILNIFTLYFTKKKRKEFKRVKKAIKALTLEGNNMKNHNADIKNPNKGTNGTNKTYDKNQGNRGNQKNGKHE